MLNVNYLSLTSFVVFCCLGLIAFYLFGARIRLFLERASLWQIGIIWVVIATAEFWIFGPASYIHFGDEGETAFPYFLYLSEFASPPKHLPHPIGGADAYSLFSSGFEALSFQAFLFKVFPSWVAVGLDKIVTTGLGFFGAYMLARASGSISKVDAVAIAAVYTLIFSHLVVLTLAMSFGLALLPLVIYVICYRLDSKHRLIELCLLAVVAGPHIVPVQVGLGFYTAVLIAVIYSGAWRRLSSYLAVLGMILIQLIVWADTLYAMSTFADLTSRVQVFSRDWSLWGFFNIARVPALHISFLIVVVLVCSQKNVVNKFLRLSLLLFGPLILSYVCQAMPWEVIGLGFLNSISFTYMNDSLFVLAILALSLGLSGSQNDSVAVDGRAKLLSGSRKGALVLLYCLPFGILGYYKSMNLSYWLGAGSQANLVNVPNLLKPDWHQDGYRVSAVPYHFEDNNLLPYGFKTFGGYFQLFEVEKKNYWDQMGRTTSSGRLILGTKQIRNPCTPLYLDDLGDPILMAVANVKYLVSYIPLSDQGIRQVSGPEPDNYVSKCDLSVSDKVKIYLERRFEPNPMFVYDLGETLPFSYFAKSVVSSAYRTNEDGFWRDVRDHASDYGVVLGMEAPPFSHPESSSSFVVKASETQDTYYFDIDANDGGVFVLNVNHNPFWRAFVDGKETSIQGVNGVHMAVAIPPKAKRIVFSYDRPLLSDKIQSYFK